MKRNNVEATIFQYCFHSRNNKTRYRGLLKHKLYSYARCLWMNHVRLMIYLITTCQGTTENGSKAIFRYLNDSIMEMLFFFVNFILSNSFRLAAENSTNYNVKLKNAAFYSGLRNILFIYRFAEALLAPWLIFDVVFRFNGVGLYNCFISKKNY